MQRLVDTEEAAKLLGITGRAIRKKISKGKLDGEYMQGKRGGRSGQVLKVWIDDDQAIGKRQEVQGKPKNRYRVRRGEPGCHIITPFENGEPVPISNIPVGKAVAPQNTGAAPINTWTTTVANAGAPLSPTPSLAAPPCQTGDGGGFIREEKVDASTDSGKSTNPKMARIANLRFALVSAFNKETSQNHRPKKEIVQHFLSLYNTGLLLPDVYKDLREISRSTLYNWIKSTGPEDLIPSYGGAGQSKITEHEKNLLLTLLLHQNRLKTAYAITLTKEYLVRTKIESPSSPATLRRFADQFRREHYDLWILHREGEKALNDKVLPYAERDWHLLDVGDGLVADGHRLNFQVIHPVTGKPCRAALVLFWDWRSSYPLGWEIMVEENIQCVASALRNAIVALGKTPKWVYLDNGKAFKARIFTEDINFEDSELPGMFARLNINYHFAQPYNAQAKPIERIFGVLNEQLERMVPSYTGASINDKPAWTRRNEKLARSVHDPYVPTIPEAGGLIRAWRDQYAERPSRARDGLRPVDIYNDGKGPGADPADLVYLMMDREIKQVHRNGVTWLGWHWYDEAMYGLKDKVLIRYSLSDLSQIYVFYKNEYLCVAKPIEQVHPMASESESPKDIEAVRQVIRLKQKVKNTTRKLSDLLETKQASQIDWARASRQPQIAETIQKIEASKKKIVNLPFVKESDEEAPAISSGEGKAVRFDSAWERYEYHLKGGVYNGPELDKRFIDDYRAGKIAPGEYEVIYGERRIDRERKVCHD